ncbi:hypothetical protein ASD02_18175 [Ensifer sp. Root1252]|nr:hypothetical protein ASD02_18175 [Ensifer sp. Root1252]KQW56215.1 hypothetical protein ASD03_17605 [Ensifer sp. Root127]KQY61582.1 hypothetical protein ASD52_17100 [Ensifer sp. Root142]KRC55295.1 hypothetical protein ASE32_21485 [Ensifer sp. Root231]KRC87119.1 hypothetical protein ASE47_15645 [Ensifer sp. Root258]OMQ43899.1 hypothetical protein BKP54_16140 [Ensifer sp. 1H6]PSS63576.1 hypothetical protein C6558_16385 [Ensifer sp. NM-2]
MRCAAAIDWCEARSMVSKPAAFDPWRIAQVEKRPTAFGPAQSPSKTSHLRRPCIHRIVAKPFK